MPAKVAAIEYDPNRSARIALLHYADGAKPTSSRRPGSGWARRSNPARGRHPPGQRAAAREHPDRHARPQRRAQAGQGRADGTERGLGDPARRQRRPVRCCASRPERCAACCSSAAPPWARSAMSTTRTSRPGRPASRWLGKRPVVRGSAMNPVDHPHGGGEGKSKAAGTRSPPGACRRSASARRKHKESDKLIVRGRRRGKERR